MVIYYRIKIQCVDRWLHLCLQWQLPLRVWLYRFYTLFIIHHHHHSLILLTNFAIALRFMRAKCRNIQSNSTESTNQALSKSATRGTAMVVTVSVTFLILRAPTAVHLTINPLGIRFPLYLAFMNLTQYLNNSINGVLYIIVGSKFRKELIELFHRKKGPGARRLPTQSLASPT